MSEMIEVSSAYLRRKEKELTSALQTAQQNFLDASQMLTKLEDCFCSDAVKIMEKSIIQNREAGLSACRALQRHIQKLSALAEVYDEAERSNTSAIQGKQQECN